MVPPEVSDAVAELAERGHVRAYGTLQGVEIRGTLVPRGSGHWLFLHGGMRAAAGVAVGDTVDLDLRATAWDDVPVPKDALRELRRAGALAEFQARGPSERHELLRWIEIADSPERRARRLAELVERLRGEDRPVETGRSTKRRKPLWICPKCGHRFANTNQWHSCRRYTLEEVFARSDPAIRHLFDRLHRMVSSVGPVHLQAYRDHVAFLVRVRFLGATPRKRWLDVGFWLPHRLDSPRLHKVETLTPTNHVHLLRITDESQLDAEVQGWIRQAYRVGRQEHLT